MTRVEMTLAAAVLALGAFTFLAHLGNRASEQIASRIETVPAAKAPTFTRTITSIVTDDPVSVGSVPKPRAPAR